MLERLRSFVSEYDRRADEAADVNDEQRSLHNPLVFLFVGEKSTEALDTVRRLMELKCTNSEAILYLHLSDEGTSKAKETGKAAGQLFSLNFPFSKENRASVRPDLHRSFYQSKETLSELNRLIRRAGNRLAESGRLYVNFQRLNLAVVTQVDDPLNVLLPEFLLLVKSILGESFKHVQTDLYALMKEGEADEEFAYAAAMGYSFLTELDAQQTRSYSLQAPLLLTEDGFALEVEHLPSPLFDLVYLLGDKDEHGILAKKGLELAYKTIASLNLLKNRRTVHEYDRDGGGVYNNLQYKQSITSPAVPENIYSSAGYAEVRRPNQAIALMVLKQVYHAFCSKLESSGGMEGKDGAQLFGLDAASVNRVAASLLPAKEKLEEMHALLAADQPLDKLKRSSLREVEEELYGSNCRAFFARHFEQVARSALMAINLRTEAERKLAAELRPPYTFYSVYRWTDESEEAGLHKVIARQLEETGRQLDDAQYALQRTYEQLGDTLQSGSGFSFLAKTAKRRFRRELIAVLYSQHYDVLALQMKRELLLKWEDTLTELHQGAGQLVSQLQLLKTDLKDAAQQIIGQTADDNGDDLGRNLREYYSKQVARIIAALAANRGPEFFLDSKYFGDIAALLIEGRDKLLTRLIEICRREVFTDAVFAKSFEEELLDRANVTVGFEERNLILTKEELYRDLFERLETGATIRLSLFNYTQKHRYEEKYFFGDFESEFIRYAFALDRGNRTYQLGCVHERKTSGIDKLNIMGGFRMDDVMFGRNARKYYDSYVANGFNFHP
ncbi:MAG: hypothetical protein H7X86_06270 [Gorillibacterium sp.]|nr:hypothetical protein [Gorillibacterium sp.]